MTDACYELTSRETVSDNSHVVGDIRRHLNRNRRCRLCGVLFTYATSIGVGECMRHPKGSDGTVPIKRACCGAPLSPFCVMDDVDSRCQRIDHVADAELLSADLPLLYIPESILSCAIPSDRIIHRQPHPTVPSIIMCAVSLVPP